MKEKCNLLITNTLFRFVDVTVDISVPRLDWSVVVDDLSAAAVSDLTKLVNLEMANHLF
jgi:hypothetical protein